MKPFLKKLLSILLIVFIAVAFAVAGFYFNKYGLDFLKRTKLVEQIPFGEVIEITGFEEKEFYNSKNEFIGAEIRIKVRFASKLEPVEKLPSEYKRGIEKAYSNVVIIVKEIPSKELLDKMKEALEGSEFLKLIDSAEVQVSYIETKINKKRVKSIEEIFVKPESYYFIK
ncbi:MAG: hypothetical protein HQ555_11150 [Candidatus Aminicenantes bacterium]|nr:hypothetical protein [Candidatus Aminicenantes bacterium]